MACFCLKQLWFLSKDKQSLRNVQDWIIGYNGSFTSWELHFVGKMPDLGGTDLYIVMKWSAQLDDAEKVPLHRFYSKPRVGGQHLARFWPSGMSMVASGMVRVMFLTSIAQSCGTVLKGHLLSGQATRALRWFWDRSGTKLTCQSQEQGGKWMV